jgi:Spy/CpxP family protein refolding chaperone
MHPGMIAWWHARRGRGCGTAAHWGGHGDREDAYEAAGQGYDGDNGAFGVRRPLRFLAYKLELKREQVAELAKILDELKTERAQAAVDGRRTLAGLADAVEGDAFDDAKARAAADTRVKSAERLRDAVVKALGRIHAILEPEQRKHLAYLIRTGTLLI